MLIQSIVQSIIQPVVRSVIDPLRIGSGFSPLSLFKAGEQGAWYDPSDTTTLFQDSAGTTPVTASGQPVGLMLDKSKGLVRGPELVANGTFDNGLTGWTVTGTTSSLVDGALQVSDPASNTRTYQTGKLIPGKAYEVRLDVLSFDPGVSIHLRNDQLGSELGVVVTFTVAAGLLRAIFVANGVDFNLVTSGAPKSITIDNISVRELPGNHATQPTAGSRPIYRRGDSRGVVNLLKWSEDFSNAVWGKSGVTVSAAASSAFKVDFASNSQYVQQSTTTVEGGANYAVSIEAKRNSGKCVLRLTKSDSSVLVRANLDTATQALVFKNTSGSATFTSATVTPVDAEFDRYTLVGNFTATQVFAGLMLVREASDETTITVRKAQMSKASTALPYQRNDSHLGGVATGASTDLHWLETDGVDDGMVTNSIDFRGTDKVAVFAGVRKLSDANTGAFCEHGRPGIDVGAWNISAPRSASFQLFSAQFRDATNIPEVRGRHKLPPNTAIVYASMDYAALTLDSQIKMRENAVNQTDKFGTVASGNFGNYPLYLFRRGGTTLPFNGWFYGLAITGRLTTDAETAATERYLAAKSGVTL